MKVLLAVDGSPYTMKMLAYLAAYPQFLMGASDLTALTVVLPLPVRARAVMDKDAVTEYQAKEAADALDTVEQFFKRQNLAGTVVWQTGVPAETIANFSHDGDFDMIIMGSRGHNKLQNLALGSVATKVLARSDVPVLLIP